MPQRLTSISGFGLVRLLYDRGYVPGEIANECRVSGQPATEWQYRFLSLEGSGTLLWYADESQMYPESFAAVKSEPQATGEALASQEQVLRMEANVGSDGRQVTLEVAVPEREAELWQNLLMYHLEEADEFGLRGTTASFAGNAAADQSGDTEYNALTSEHMDAVVSIFLKDNQHTLTLAMGGDASLLASQFIKEQGLRNDFATQIEMELLRAQLEVYRTRENQLLRQFSKVQRKVHGIVVAEAHASMAENLAAELTEAMSKVRAQIVPDLQAKVYSLEKRCLVAEKAAEEAQIQQVISENQYIAENVRLKQELQEAKKKPGYLAAGSGRSPSPSKTAREPASSKEMHATNVDNVDSVFGNGNSPSKQRARSPGTFAASTHSHVADHDGVYGQDKLMSELQELRNAKVALGKQLRACQDELNCTQYELNQAYGKKAAQRKKLNFSDVIDEPAPMSLDSLKILNHKQKERIEALLGTRHTAEKERESLYIKVGELEGKVNALDTRCTALQTEKVNAVKKLLELQEDHDFKTISSVQAENRNLREEVIKFRGEAVQARLRIDEITQNAASVLQYPRVVNDANVPAEGAGLFPPPAPRTLTLDTSNRTAARSEETAQPTAAVAVLPSDTPRSALLSQYPAMSGGASQESKTADNSSLFGLFAAVEGTVQATPFSKAHSPNPNRAISDAVNSTKNDTSVKWHPPEHDALSQRLSPIVEDRLLRVIYNRYIHEHKGPSPRDIMLANLPSASNGASSAAFAHAASTAKLEVLVSNNTMTLGRFVRFAKEFHLCFVGNGGAVTCTPPYLVSGEIDVIFHNAAKLKVIGDESSKEPPRPYGFRSGAGSDKQYMRTHTAAQTTGLTLTPGQFLEAVKNISCKLYANVIELQTGTVLDCLPPRQKKAAARAVFDVLIKKKLLPIAEKLELVPWPLIYLEQTVNVFGEFKVAQQCLSSHFPQLVLWFDHYKTTYVKPSASAVALAGSNYQDSLANSVKIGITYKSMSQFAHDFGMIPYLLKEPQLYGLFQEFMLWSTLRPDELHKSLPKDVMHRAAHRDRGEEEDPEELVHFGQNEAPLPFGMSPYHARTPSKASKSPSHSTWSSTSTNSSLSPKKSSSHSDSVTLPLSCGLPPSSTPSCRLGLMSFATFCGSIAQHAFPDHAPEHRMLKLFELCAQSGGTYMMLAQAKAKV